VAEHAVFNFDIIGVTRYLSEFIQYHRLCSYTEKSQRYIKLGKDYIIPDEIREAGIADRFESFVMRQFERYNEIRDHLVEDLQREPTQAGEDARYILPFAVTTQMGMTINARNLGYLLRRAASSRCREFLKFGENLFKTVDGVAPSVIKYTGETPYLKETDSAVKSLLGETPCHKHCDSEPEEVKLLYVTPDADKIVGQALAFRFNGCADYPEEGPDRSEVFREVLRRAERWDPAHREFEYAAARFELIISAAAYAQFKRHRMATITAGPYNTELGITVPPAFVNTKAEKILRTAAYESSAFYHELLDIVPQAAPYVLLSAHRRTILVQASSRELIHLSRLREDEHAQWDIRNLVAKMIKISRPHMPNCLMMAVGKHLFEDHHRSVYGE